MNIIYTFDEKSNKTLQEIIEDYFENFYILNFITNENKNANNLV